MMAAFTLMVCVMVILPTRAEGGRPQLHRQRLEVGRALLEVQFANRAEVLPYYTYDIEYHAPIVV